MGMVGFALLEYSVWWRASVAGGAKRKMFVRVDRPQYNKAQKYIIIALVVPYRAFTGGSTSIIMNKTNNMSQEVTNW